MARFVRGKQFKTTDGFPTIPVAKRVETIARFGRRKKFETTDGFPTIRGQSLKQRMDLQISQCKKVSKIWLDLEDEKSLKQRMDFQQSQCKKALKLWLDLEEEKV